MTDLRSSLRSLLLDARRSADRELAAVVRGVLAELDNAAAVPVADAPGEVGEHVAGGTVGLGSSEVARRALTAEDEAAVIRRELDEAAQSLSHLPAERAADRARAIEAVRAVL